MTVFSCLRPTFQNGLQDVSYLCKNILRIKPHQTRGLRTRRQENGRQRLNFAPEEFLETPREGRMFPGLVKSFVFALGFSACTFGGAAIWQYENVKKMVPNSFNEWINKNWGNMQGWEHKEGDLRKALNKWWNSLAQERQVFWQIFAMNALVFALWYHPSMKATMFRFFCSTPAARAVCWPMVFSTFSHLAPLHFCINMYVLHSFSMGISHTMGKEQFWAFYLTGGLASSLVSHIVKVGRGMTGPSLGASGAIMALLGYFCTKNPDAMLGIVFVPGFAFSAATAIKGIICLDTAGLIFGWKLLDHAAHLGGALFGITYAAFGQKYLWNDRRYIIKHWESLRTRLKTE